MKGRRRHNEVSVFRPSSCGKIQCHTGRGNEEAGQRALGSFDPSCVNLASQEPENLDHSVPIFIWKERWPQNEMQIERSPSGVFESGIVTILGGVRGKAREGKEKKGQEMMWKVAKLGGAGERSKAGWDQDEAGRGEGGDKSRHARILR